MNSNIAIEDRLHSAGYKTERIGGVVNVHDPVCQSMPDASELVLIENGVTEWRDEALRTREAATALLEALEWLISKEPDDSPMRGVLVARAAIAKANELVYENPRKLIKWGSNENGVTEWRDEALRTREAAIALLEALEWLISKEPDDSPMRGVLVARAAIAKANGVLHV